METVNILSLGLFITSNFLLVCEAFINCVFQTSNATVWCLYNLAKHPEVQAKMVDEIQKALPNNETLTASKLSELPYVKAVLKETLR